MLPLSLATARPDLDTALLVALGDLAGSLRPVQAGLLAERRMIITAGLHYPQLWTRDAAVNVWNAGSILLPDIAGDSLKAVLARDGEGFRFPHPDYYDTVVWLSGAWAHARASGDRDGAGLALAVARDRFPAWERDDFSPEIGLFRGGSFFNDGIAGYPDRYTRGGRPGSNILDWLAGNPVRHPQGGGLPMHCLSTNCLYLLGYQAAAALADAVGERPDPHLERRAQHLRAAIRQHFWDAKHSRLRYLIDREDVDERQEVGGWAFAILAGVLEADEATALAAGLQRSRHGIPSLWPTYERYARLGGIGRHSGLVWPHVQAFWGQACAERGDAAGLGRELSDLARAARRFGQFTECWSPISGEPDGGLQEGSSNSPENPGIIGPWQSRHRTTWGATGYLSLVLRGLVGLRDRWDGLNLAPCLPPGLGPVRVGDVPWRGLTLDVSLTGQGSRIVAARIDGVSVDRLSFAGAATGRHTVEVELAP